MQPPTIAPPVGEPGF